MGGRQLVGGQEAGRGAHSEQIIIKLKTNKKEREGGKRGQKKRERERK